MTDTDTFDYRIAMVGPTRVGKTALITAILREAKTLLAGTGVSIEAGDPETEIKIKRYSAQLKASLIAGEFDPGQIKGTQDPFKFFLDMKVIKGVTKLRLGILDYPGGWLNPEMRSSGRTNEWEECKVWMQESAVLIVPIDATVVMESITRGDLEDAIRTLETDSVADVARSWAQGKIQNSEPGLLILSPVKCESYFNDNGGIKDISEKLFERVNRFYSDVFTSVREEIEGAKQESDPSSRYTSTDITIKYLPVDTIGSVELKNARWTKDVKTGIRYFKSEFLVRDSGDFNPRGADSVLASICSHIIGQEQDRSRGFIANFWRWATRENKKLINVMKSLQDKPTVSSRKKDLEV